MDRQSNPEVSRIQTKINTFLFDLDGTLINSSKDIAVAANYALQNLGFSPLPEEEIIKHVGYGGEKLIQGILNTNNKDLISKGVKIFREYYFSNPAVHTTLYPYIDRLLTALKEQGKTIGVITNKYEDISRQILEKLGVMDRIDILIGGDTTSYKKPRPEPILYALTKLGSKPENTVMIGDSEADIQAGKQAGTKTALVLYGFGKKEIALSYNPDIVIKSSEELFKLFS
ncbi:HAD-IIIA family hydrolase [Persephonella sp.]|uniref:HAD family hydrolase n=1 Tax=Persephonella sp. TaxID=2060922 RepID=UPI00261FA44D|nr:HAD-IIIA family hydrolase [Persephonella sp.]